MSYSVFKSDKASRAARESELLAAHEQLGMRRAEVERICAENPGQFALTIKFGRGVGQSSTLGREYVASEQEETDLNEEGSDLAAAFPRVAHTTVIDQALVAPIMGAAYGNKRLGNLVMPCGVCLIVGKGGTGKTPLAHALAGMGVDEYAAVRIGEPLSGYCQSEKETALSIAMAMVTHSNVVIDSIKDLLATGSNLMKSGLSRSVLTTISDWSALANDMGCTLYIPINPSSDDEEVYALLVEAARSNATVTISHESGDNWNVSGRTGEGLPRFENVKLAFKNNEITVDGLKTRRRTEDVEDRSFSASSSVASRDAVRRIIGQSN